jgi:hypothetical protein
VEALQHELGGLLHERERLHRVGTPALLEANRVEIVRVQQALSLAFVARFGG